MGGVWITVVIAAVLIGALGSLMWRGQRKTQVDVARRGSAEALDTLSAWEPQATRVCTLVELQAMNVLSRALPDHIILAKVPLARFIRVPRRHSYTEWLRRAGQLTPDLMVCSTTSQVLAAIEIRSRETPATARAAERLERMRRVLKAAGIPLHTWTEGKLPTPDKVRETVLPKPPVTQAAAAASQQAGEAIAQAAARSTDARAKVLEALRDDDEFREQPEPPPSSWFDEDFDTRQMEPPAGVAAGAGQRPPKR